MGKNPYRGAAMLAIDQEIPIQPITNKTTNGKHTILKTCFWNFGFLGITAVVRVNIEEVLKNEDWSSTDLMKYMIDKYENEKQFSKKWLKSVICSGHFVNVKLSIQ